MNNYDTYDCLLDVAHNRRSTRRFKPDPVPDGYIEKIIDVARWAPSGFHTQPWEFVVIKKPEVKNAIVAALDRKAPRITNPDAEEPERTFRDAPVFIIVLTDWRAKTGLPGHPQEVNDTVRNIYTSSLASSFVYMHLAAAALGLASQWYSGTSSPQAAEAIRDIIGFPEDMTIYDMMVLGYPETPPGPKEVRPLAELIHYDDCGLDDFRTDIQVAAAVEKTYAWCIGEH